MMLINGQPSDVIDAADRGLHYGDGLFETLAVQEGRPCRWNRHMQRLSLGCQRLNIPCPDRAILREEALLLCADARQAVLKIIVTRGSAGRGYRCATGNEPSRILSLYPWPVYPDSFAKEGVVVRICTTRLAQNPLLAGIKHLNRLEQVLARNEWDDPAIPEGLMLDGTGHVISATMSNLFLVQDGVLFTADLSQCGVAGIMRGVILEAATELTLITTTSELTLTDVLSAHELFLCNSLIGLWPVRELAGVTFPVGPITRRIAAHLDEMPLC